MELENYSNEELSELKRMYLYLQTHTATASMIEAALNIRQKNICRYKRRLEDEKKLWQVKEKLCNITGFKAWYLTTDPKQRPKDNQYKLGL